MNMNGYPLLFRAAEAGLVGKTESYPGGRIVDVLFLFLDGKPDEKVFYDHLPNWHMRHVVCLSKAWDDFMQKRPELCKMAYPRVEMIPKKDFVFDTPPRKLPEGYALSPFDEDAFIKHPYSHGERYANYEEFRKFGSGAVMRYQGEIVSSCSSFLSMNGDVELDISTTPEHRRKGLAEACARAMLEDCTKRGITVHWDAQNPKSRDLAKKLGYQIAQEYTTYILN